nr:immunoglobulin heavy chain junction region [Mus musculus]
VPNPLFITTVEGTSMSG